MFQVSARLADKKIACASCGWSFTIPRARFDTAQGRSAGDGPSPAPSRPASAQTPPEPARVSSPAPVAPGPSPLSALDNEPAQLDLDSAIADLSGTLPEIPSPPAAADGFELKLADDDPPSGPSPARVESQGQTDDTTGVEYARDPLARPGPRGSGKDVIQGPARGFWTDAFQSFVYPFRTGANVITFIMICVASALRIPLSMLGCYALIPIFIIFGWIASLYLSVVQETASGSDDLPGIKMEDGFIDDIVKPALKYLGAFAVSMGPALAYVILMAANVLPEALVSGAALLAWLAGGIFLWPVFVLLFAFNALDMIYRIDLIFTTIFRTLGAYVSIWLMLLLVGFTWLLPLIAVITAAINLNIPIPTLDFGSSMAIEAAFDVLDVYLTIVSMRLIGLYYLHFKRRFTLVFE